MNRCRDKSIRHRPAVCAECRAEAFQVFKVVRELLDPDTTEVRRKFRCLQCRKVVTVKTLVRETVVALGH